MYPIASLLDKSGTFAHAQCANLWACIGPIVKWYYGAFALHRREFNSPWVHKLAFWVDESGVRFPPGPLRIFGADMRKCWTLLWGNRSLFERFLKRVRAIQEIQRGD